MADVMVGVRGYLLSKSAITALVGQRIYTVLRPQASQLPSITCIKISTSHEHTLSGFAGIAHSRIQFQCTAETYIAAEEIAEAIRVTGIISLKGIVYGVNIRGCRLEAGPYTDINYANDDSDDHDYVSIIEFTFDYSETE